MGLPGGGKPGNRADSFVVSFTKFQTNTRLVANYSRLHVSLWLSYLLSAVLQLLPPSTEEPDLGQSPFYGSLQPCCVVGPPTTGFQPIGTKTSIHPYVFSYLELRLLSAIPPTCDPLERGS